MGDALARIDTMRSLIRLSVFVLLALAGCASPLPPPTAPFRSDLANQWRDASGAIRWPGDDGFAAPPVLIVLPSGMLIDRFGKETGRFFSPKGAAYGARALPYVCAALVYHVYRIDRPLLAWTGKAAAWFDQPGGATQIETDATVAQLLADGELEAVPDAGPAPCP
jgi:hypothetical protein